LKAARHQRTALLILAHREKKTAFSASTPLLMAGLAQMFGFDAAITLAG